MEDIVIAGAARTAIGKFGGTLAKTPAADLGAHVMRKLWSARASRPSRSPK
jgi:acetyl-CoA C-acetyltransferase